MNDAFDEVVLPLLNALIRISISGIEHNDTAISSSVECVAQTLKPLLASCVPDLQGYDLARLDLNFLLDEVRTNRWFVIPTRLLVLVRLN